MSDALSQRLPDLRRFLRGAYGIIRYKAPKATVIVVGYPAIFGDGLRSAWCPRVAPLTRGARSNLREGAAQLNRAIEASAREFGFRFVNPNRAFAGHRICDSKESNEWFHGFTRGRGDEPKLSPITFHPKAAGQAAIADAIAAANRDVFK